MIIMEKRKIVVVDDEVENRELYRAFLARLPFDVEVVEAVDGYEAMGIIEKIGDPDLVITDLEMPRMNGIVLNNYIRDRKNNIPVILITGILRNVSEDDRNNFAACFPKPFKKDDLLNKITSIFNERRGELEDTSSEGRVSLTLVLALIFALMSVVAMFFLYGFLVSTGMNPREAELYRLISGVVFFAAALITYFGKGKRHQ